MTRVSHFTAVLVGFAKHLADNDMGVYRDDAVYAKTERGIIFSAFPETPAEIVALTLYLPEFTTPSPTAERQLTAASVQIKYRLRGNPLAGVEYFDRLLDLLNEKNVDLGPLTAHTTHQSYTQLGQANDAAWIFSTNWRIHSLRAL